MPIGRARPRGVSTSLDTSGIRGQMLAMIYLDYQATTPLAPEARGAMLRWLEGPGEGDGFAKPARPHKGGGAAAAAVDVARARVAALLPPVGWVVLSPGANEQPSRALFLGSESWRGGGAGLRLQHAAP